MSPTPLVSIVVPVFNDAQTIAAALESALSQTLPDIEVLCVDDASTDTTVDVIESFRAKDSRVRLIRHPHNRSAFQSRRTGVTEARAEHVLFLDGDDELVANAAERALSHARSSGADLVGFGVTVVASDGRTGGAYQQRLRPKHAHLEGSEVLGGLFPIAEPAQGQLWRFLFATRILRDAYDLVPDDLALPRVNDLPLMFLVACLASRYSSIEDQLYRYHYGRGGSGHRVDSIERAQFYTSAIDSIDSIRPAVEALAYTRLEPSVLVNAYESARLSIIGHVCFQLIQRSDSELLDAALAHLRSVASAHDLVHAAAKFYPETLTTLKFHAEWHDLIVGEPHSILLATSTIRTGGVSAVIASQAHYLSAAGYRVIVVARNGGSDAGALPSGTEVIELTGESLIERLEQWAAICRKYAVDVVIDHQVLYSDHWPEYALMSRAEGASTIGWLHNFVGRPIYDGSDRLTLTERCSNTLARLVVLSPLDVAYFKLRGVAHTFHMPNPPSPLLMAASARTVAKPAPSDRIELVWWGRLDERTKQVRELIEVGAHLRRLAVDFRLTVIGPDWGGLTAKKFNAEARRRGVGDRVVAIGPLHGGRLVDAIDSADVFVSTSIIEGYQLTIAEAQSRGLPVVMYDLPWLTLVQGNEGIIAVPQNDARGMAAAIADLIRFPGRFEQLSRSASEAARRARAYDFSALYRGVVTGDVPAEFSPQPTVADAQALLGLLVFFADRSHRRSTQRGGAARLSERVWKSAAPLGRTVLGRFPGLRPYARGAKKLLRVG